MKVAKKWKTVSTNITVDDYNALMEIARREGKTESELLRLAIGQLFKEYPIFDTIKGLLTSKAMEQVKPSLIDAIIPAFEKAFESGLKEYNEAKQRNPKLQKLEDKAKEEIRKAQGEVFPFETNEQKKGMPKDLANRSRGINELKSMKEIETTGARLNEKIKKITNLELEINKTKSELKDLEAEKISVDMITKPVEKLKKFPRQNL